MKFTTPCFVRVDNAEERQELLKWAIEIGYHHIWEPGEHRYGSFVICDEDCVGKAILPEDFADCDFVDCGTNVELFKALAAMNDENTSEQWLVNDLGIWIKCAADLFGYTKGEYNVTHLRKATSEEIVEHFKNKEA